MRKLILFLLLLLVVSCGSNTRDYVDGIIVFDNNLNYPETKLKLSDVADIRYIRLKGMDEGFLVANLNNKGGNLFTDGRTIYIKQERCIYVYDMEGNPLRKLDRIGNGPEEYKYINSFWVDPEENSVYVYDGRGLLVYDTLFAFKRRVQYSSSLMHSMVPVNNKDVLLHDKLKGYSNKAPYLLGSETSGELHPLPVILDRPYVHDFEGMLEHPALIYGQGGIFMCNMCSDTVRWLDRSLNVSARFVDKTAYEKPDIMAVPAFETDDYLFFSLIFSPIANPDMEERAFVFDKRDHKIYRLPNAQNRKFALATDYCFLTCRNNTLNEDYAVVLYQAIDLIDNKDILPGELRKIAETMNENDNPVLGLIKFR